MDDGRLTDGKGRVVDFKNTILIMTSNLGSLSLAGDLSSPERWARASEQVMSALRGHFKPEFLNRVDDVVVFHPLGVEQLTKIVELRLAELRTLLAGRKITLELTEAAKKTLFTTGYDPAYGARPLKRAIQRAIQDPLAMKILDGEVLHGDHVVVDSKDGKLSFEVTHHEDEAAKVEEAEQPA
jgi:ATP-dependent Clp protease ATP-binding subunit ClpB